MHNIFDLLCKLKILVRDSLRGMVLQSNLDPGIGRGDVRMMPRRLGEMTDGIDHHQRAFPTVGAIFAADPAVLQVPMWQITLESLLNLFIRVGSLFFGFGHWNPSIASWFGLPTGIEHRILDPNSH